EVWHKEMGTFGKLNWKKILNESMYIFDSIWSEKRRKACLVGYPFIPSVDIIVAVHNACSSAVKCIESIQRETPTWIKKKITVVDDCGDAYTNEKLNSFSDVNVIKTKVNSGYLPSIDLATKKTSSPWICYVNSDVIVTDGWIAKMIYAAELGRDVAIVNPFTNNAAHLSIQYPFGSNFQDCAEKVVSCSERRRFEIVTPVGFCMLVWREALEEVGGYDVEYYGRGYGEECDLYMRLEEAGWSSIMCDDAFVYHEGGQTFSQFGKQQEFEYAGYKKFIARWKNKIEPKLKVFNRESPHFYIRNLLENQKTERPEVVFVFREVTLCGGVLAVVRICNRLNELGWNASFACTKAKLSELKKMGLRFTPYIFRDKNDLVRGLSKRLTVGAKVIATIWVTVNEVVEIQKKRRDIEPWYFVQDAEYKFCFPSGVLYAAKEKVVATYNMIERKIVNSDWVIDEIVELGAEGMIKKIGIGVDTNMFYPEKKKESLIVMAHCRPSTPRRGWDFISDVFKQVQKIKSDFTIVVYDQKPKNLECDYRGQVTSQKLGKLMREASVFFEGSKYQGWGMQALEAMSSGLALVSTQNRGIDNYGTDGHDYCGVLYGDVEGAAKTLLDFLNDEEARRWYGKNARTTAERFDWRFVGDEWNRVLKG
ncbi:MAG: glycosyltransferase, partial [Candidatus Thorarchaeota archaeon]